MKKLLLPLIAMVVLFSGCGEKAHIITSYYQVHSDQWDLMTDGSYYYSEWSNSDITPDVINEGVVLAYYIDDDNRDNLLPYTLYFTDNGTPYQERIEYDIERGKITFKVKTSDFGPTTVNTRLMRFKVCVIRNY